MLKTDFNHNASPIIGLDFIPNVNRYRVGVKIGMDGLVCRRLGISCRCNPFNSWAKRMDSCQSDTGSKGYFLGVNSCNSWAKRMHSCQSDTDCQGIFYLCNPFNPWAKTVRGCPLRRCHPIEIQLIKKKYIEYTKNNIALYTKNTTFTYTKYGTLAFTKYAT